MRIRHRHKIWLDAYSFLWQSNIPAFAILSASPTWGQIILTERGYLGTTHTHAECVGGNQLVAGRHSPEIDDGLNV